MRYEEIARHVDLDQISIDQLTDILKVDPAPTVKSSIDLPPERVDFISAMYGQDDDTDPDDLLTLAKAEAERARARASRAAADADRARAARDRAEAEATRAETRRQSRSNISKRFPRPISRPR